MELSVDLRWTGRNISGQVEISVDLRWTDGTISGHEMDR